MLTPRYGERSLADLMPSVLAGLGVPGERDVLGLDLAGVRQVCVLLVDGLGALLLRAHQAAAPFLSTALGPQITAGFPSTTAASLGSLGTGLPPGEHGLVGYLLAVDGYDRPMNPLLWRLHGPGDHVDLVKTVVPEVFQPAPTTFERAVADGIEVVRVGPRYQQKSGLTRAVLRGGDFRPAVSYGDLAAETIAAMAGDRTLVYAYHGDLDLTGHVRGPSSAGWRAELAHVDQIARDIAEGLPPGGVLIVTADHGMVEVGSSIDIDADAELQDGVRIIGGEPRARHLYAEDGAAQDVYDLWRERLGDEYGVYRKAELVEDGWFGPTITSASYDRIGDVIAIALTDGALFRSGAEPMQSSLKGHHGSLTEDELLVPLLVFRR
ncbi:putative AlkP superfamily pyrophosphatase or phosphodiesterase [Antricoccus suffuscus]|uniref:Putative AlkP superfamily pyrophosphatase or phosphodiesterase n=1 Tax=Antricoccus suffuscus TaxID=1629062 RepID=A0A2T0ZZY3_9ACTN|nr:nucleotide pyrophosphatase/phosphodiesterase family protein [Antricoccus suffuscus]PRZ41902.1 putative AlkP superfamily pyrophosphatase or phosphodiesterase [Antricoccus suffuscus]